MGSLHQFSSKAVQPDICLRCGGMTVPELMVEELQEVWGARCVHCGDRRDPVILANRASQARHEEIGPTGLRRHGALRLAGSAP